MRQVLTAGTVTLTPAATSTTVTSIRAVGPYSIVHLEPCTLNAAAARATTYVKPADMTADLFVVTHANTADVDKTFFYMVVSGDVRA